jgi:hypothetical protein
MRFARELGNDAKSNRIAETAGTAALVDVRCKQHGVSEDLSRVAGQCQQRA